MQLVLIFLSSETTGIAVELFSFRMENGMSYLDLNFVIIWHTGSCQFCIYCEGLSTSVVDSASA